MTVRERIRRSLFPNLFLLFSPINSNLQKNIVKGTVIHERLDTTKND